MPVRTTAPLLLLALSLAWGCPQPEPVEEPPTPTPTPAPDEPFVFNGLVRDYDGLPVAGAELAIGEQIELTGVDGWARFELEQGPPVQVDFFEEPGRVDTDLTCADQQSFWLWTGTSSTWQYGTLDITVHGLVEPDGLKLALVYLAGTEPYTYVSWRSISGAWLTEVEAGVWTGSMNSSATSQWELVASEARPDGTASFARLAGGHGLEVDEVIEVSINLEDAAGGLQPWDGQVADGPSRLVLQERIEVMGEGIFMPVLSIEPDGQPRDLSVLDGHLDVLEYRAEFSFDGSACDTQELDLTLPPLFPPDELSLPELPPPPVIAVEGEPDRPDLVWTDAFDGSTRVYADVWDETGDQLLTDWFAYARSGCGERATWPVFLDPVKETDLLQVAISTNGDGVSGYCSATIP